MCVKLQYSLKALSINSLLLFFVNASLTSYSYQFKRYSAAAKKFSQDYTLM